MTEEHAHVYRLTPLREDEVPRSPIYPKGTYVFGCTLPGCGHLYFGNPWVDGNRKAPSRKDVNWSGDAPSK